MLKRHYSRKLFMCSAVLFALLLVCMVPKDKMYTLKDVGEKVVYVDKEVQTSVIFLLDKNDYVARTKVATVNTESVSKLKELIQILIQGGEGENKIPSGFKSILPSETKLNSISLEEGILKLDFSKELLTISASLEEKMIESIIYTVTNVEGVEKVILYVEGEVLTKLPQTGNYLPSTLDRSFGINKEYDLTSFHDIQSVTVYYVSKYNEDYYYVPVTKYVNDQKDKIKIIIDELVTGPTVNSNLMSFLNSKTELLSSMKDTDTMSLVFNDYIFNNLDEQNILEEVIYTISLSVADNFNVKEVSFEVGEQEIYKSVIKTLE